MANESPVVKHHFWILAGATPLFIGLAFLLMLILVGGSLDAAQKELKAAKDGLTSAKPPTSGAMKAMSDQVDTLEGNRKTLWGMSYDEQRNAKVFAWPEGGRAEFRQLAKEDMKFGEKFILRNRVTDPPVLKDAFDRGYTQAAESIAPTRFAGGSYLSALRTVTNWGEIQVQPEPFWLALEDFWVQRGLLEPIAKVNADAALFEDVTPKDSKDATELKRNFRTRTWELDLEVTQKGNKQVILGQLRNRTGRLQALGVNKAMKVKVWLSDPKGGNDSQDVVFEIRGESVPGKGFINCTPQEINAVTVTKISRVLQVFDEATVPVRLVNTVELNMLDHRNKAATLELPKHIEADEAANPDPAAAPVGGEGGIPGGGGPGRPGGPPGGPGGLSGLGGVGAGGEGGEGGRSGMYGGSAGTRSAKGGSIQTALLANKKRYLKRTDDVRRMPVAVSVVIDNDYISDLMVAYTNSPLHFQITQTQWARFKSTLPPISGATSGGSSPTGSSPTGEEGPSPGPGSVPGPGIGRGRPGPGIGVPGVPGIAGGPGGFGDLGGGTLTNTSSGALPGEANANLCEFVLFGIVSLYEKVPPPEKKADDADPTKTDPTKTDPTKTDPTKTDPEKKEPEKKQPDAQDPVKKDVEKKEPEKKAPPTDDSKKDPSPAPTPPNK